MNITVLGILMFLVRGKPQRSLCCRDSLFINRLLKNEQPVIYGSGEQSRDFTYVSMLFMQIFWRQSATITPDFIYIISDAENPLL